MANMKCHLADVSFYSYGRCTRMCSDIQVPDRNEHPSYVDGSLKMK